MFFWVKLAIPNDLISNKLIGDINVTSPTGLKQYETLNGINLAEDFWDGLGLK